MSLLLGCIADDFTGATDLASMLVRQGMATVQLIGVLGRQSKAPVGLIAYAAVEGGPEAIRSRSAELRRQGVRQAIADATSERHLLDLGTAAADLALITGGSGIAMGLPENFRRVGLLKDSEHADALPPVGGHAAVLAGSCSAATLEQIERFAANGPVLALDPLALVRDGAEVERAIAWAEQHLGEAPVLIRSSAPPEEVARVQAAVGRDRAGEAIEAAMARI